jgi:diguanylate cyclase (GGDEF)-like protein/PAS domain S-box-containing protein
MVIERNHSPGATVWLSAAAGAAALCYAAAGAVPFDLPFLLFALVTLSLGTRVGLRLPGATVTAADGFVVAAIFMFGGAQAVLLAAAASFCATLRVSKGWKSPLADALLAALAAFASIYALEFGFGPLTALGREAGPETLALALCAVAGLHALVSLVGGSASTGEGGLAQVSDRFLRTFTAFLAISSLAGVAARAAHLFGQTRALLFLSAVALAHFVYGVYLRRTEATGPGGRAERPSTRVGGHDVFQEAFEGAAIGMAVVSSRGRWLRVNRSMCELLGYSEEELLTKKLADVMHPDDLGGALANLKDLLKGKTSAYLTEKRFLRRDGTTTWALWNVARVIDRESGEVRLISQAQDVTERKVSEERLIHNAFHDALTGLPNRALLMDHVKLTIARSKRRADHLFAVLFLDLDRFKVINDSLGHLVGDQLLVGIARRLEQCLREGDTVARVGGDEFTILLEDIGSEDEAVEVAERIQRELSAPFNLEGHEVFTTASIGIALSTIGYDGPEDILRDADTAMYRAKSLGKARHEVFDKAMHAIAVNLLQMETDLRKALERRELYMLYQPIVSLDDFRLCGFEALVRWQHPERGLISPMDFIPVAEDTGQIIPIGEFALHEACRQMRRWQKLFPSDTPLFISVNLSGKQFNQPNLIEMVRSTLAKTRLEPRSLKLEITESVVMENIETATEMLRELREIGVQLAIDDFGTGYSSLSYLHRFPIDTLKIDRSFVTRMVDNSENIEIVRTIVMLAQNLGMDVVAEGVETKDQLALLRKLGCENGQGYYFSRPSTAVDAEKILGDTFARPQTVGVKSPAPPPPPPPDNKVKSFRLA